MGPRAKNHSVSPICAGGALNTTMGWVASVALLLPDERFPGPKTTL